MNNQQLWQAILGNLEVSLSRGNFNTWFKNTSVMERGSDYIIVNVPSTFNRDWIASKYHHEMLKALKTIAPEIKEIKYQLGSAPASASPVAASGRPIAKQEGATTHAAEKPLSRRLPGSIKNILLRL